MEHSELDNKMRILLSAKKLFAKQGYDGTSVRQICEEANANIALVSYHFGGKEKVFEALFLNLFPAKKLLEMNDLLQDPVEGMRTMIHGIIKFTIADKELSDIVQQEIMLESNRMRIVLEFVNPMWSKVKQLLEKGKEEGVFHFTSLPQALLMVINLSLAHKKTCLIEKFFPNDDIIPDILAEQTVEFILRGLGAVER
ncbi:TetR family transcriptional regulator [Paenibacillus antarcticus]|uniref:TetR family transcriptional regulator n=1 Tax=Paenibacillus antarcticus TaxID=253703 RepID=A0A168NC74_9BACL|nr:TetR family transcriptional regulator [Paenibacillus antarcticus]OAB45639.1 TetR family transcriptional regulator [Paenibacillus antarcticus]